MEFLKWIGCILVSIMGLCLVVGALTFIATIGVTLGAIALGAFIILFLAMAIKEYFESS